ncbi:hypothetical protein H310_12833 [Aphanomyces invadans]|uniref:WRKY transcription factor 19 n=1 Tax=Aphanomyces invadans TaxID=157072 RepID=A0A024TFR7_9STRA|nr:hypothetical protein H310_12833 [Aphanomyces invadans]ETV92995.1 hypothetical protein H310_12833 [Aphanomyces invadans]|eukprot:XP_008878260.1 hypothetical protein H310_12833 [Aphanomyces invadans]
MEEPGPVLSSGGIAHGRGHMMENDRNSELTEMCHFNGCAERVRPGTRKCAFHRKKGICHIHNCHNQVYARGLCVRHGARKPCNFPKCEGYARNGGFCTRHGDRHPIKLCSVQGCQNKAHARQKCVRHGGGQKCKADGCDMHARTGGWCSRHTPMDDADRYRIKPFRPPTLEHTKPCAGISMHDICHLLSASYGLPTLVNMNLAQSCTALPSIKLSSDSKPYFIVHDFPDDDELSDQETCNVAVRRV